MQFVIVSRNLNQIRELYGILVNFCEVMIVAHYDYVMIVDLFFVMLGRVS
jgi:hypothetical protein